MSETNHEIRKKEADEKQRIYEQTVHDLQNEERYKNYFSAFSESTVKSFIEYYAHTKAGWFVNSESMLNLRKHHETQWKKNAFMVLEHIQLKKLFNAECEWRAEKLKIREVEICMDFLVWKRQVLECHFIRPVTEEELKLYISFLDELDDNLSFDDYNISNDYSSLKEGFYKTGKYYSEYPPWYSYYDAHFGTDALLALPDIRGDKENSYTGWYRKEQQLLWEAQNASRDKRPNLPPVYEKDFMKWFLKEFDSKETLKQYQNSLEWDEKNQRIEDIDMELIDLSEADRSVEVDDDNDWRKGIKRAAEMYYRKRTVEVLPAIWQEYCRSIADDKPFKEEDEKEDNSFTDLRKKIMENIMRGRELNNEPRDLNF